jgi:hypothetical protein
MVVSTAQLAKTAICSNRCASWRRVIVALVISMACGSCRSLPERAAPAAGECVIDGPPRLAPRHLAQLRLGLPKSAVDRLMGPPAQSPTPAEYYYFTGGQCPLGNHLTAPCGVAALFTHQEADEPAQHPEASKLQRCWWGAIVTGFSRERSIP